MRLMISLGVGDKTIDTQFSILQFLHLPSHWHLSSNTSEYNQTQIQDTTKTSAIRNDFYIRKMNMAIGDKIIEAAKSMINSPHYFLINLVISAHSHFWAALTKIGCGATIVCNNSSSVKRFARNCMVTSKLRQIGNLNFCDPHQQYEVKMLNRSMITLF